MVGPEQYIRQRFVERLRCLVSGPVSGALDQPEVEIRPNAPQHRLPLTDFRISRRVELAVDRAYRGAHAGHRLERRHGARQQWRAEPVAPRMPILDRESQIVDLGRIVDHQGGEVGTMPLDPVGALLMAHRHELQGPGAAAQAARPIHRKRSHALPVQRRNEATDHAAEREPNHVVTGFAPYHEIEAVRHDAGDAVLGRRFRRVGGLTEPGKIRGHDAVLLRERRNGVDQCRHEPLPPCSSTTTLPLPQACQTITPVSHGVSNRSDRDWRSPSAAAAASKPVPSGIVPPSLPGGWDSAEAASRHVARVAVVPPMNAIGFPTPK